MSEFKQCPNGHYYEGDFCPYCTPTRPMEEDHGPYECIHCKACSEEYNGGKCPYCGEQLKSVSNQIPSWWFSDLTRIIPICKHCGHRLRRTVPPSEGVVSYIHSWQEKIAPWNYKWDGKCEYCGHDYRVQMELNVDDMQKKQTEVYADMKMVLTPPFVDEFTCLSGVTIRTAIGGQPSGEVFLSANELRYLMDSLKESPLMEQYDYLFDGT